MWEYCAVIMCVSEKNISRGLSLEIGPYYFETKSKSEAYSWKHSFRNTFEFVILGTKNQMKGLRKAYSPVKTTKVSWVWSEISLSETGSSIFSTNFFFIPIIFLNLVSTDLQLYFFWLYYPFKKHFLTLLFMWNT